MKKMSIYTLRILIGFNVLFLSACSSSTPVTNNQAGTLSKASIATVKKGVVLSVKKVSIMGSQGSGGRTVGSITGSIIGSGVPYAGSIIGSLLGGAIGGEAEKAATKKAGLEITLQLNSGETVIVTQLADTAFKTGDKIQLIMQDQKALVAHLDSNS